MSSRPINVLHVVGARPNFVKVAALMHAMAAKKKGVSTDASTYGPALRSAYVGYFLPPTRNARSRHLFGRRIRYPRRPDSTDHAAVRKCGA